MDPQLYRRRQRRRAAIGWTALIAIVALVVVGIAVGSDGGTDHDAADLQILPVRAEMTSTDYASIREGEEEGVIVGRLGSGLREGQVDGGLLALFPAQPGSSHCAFWALSDAPEHLVRLCFDDDRGVLLQKSVAAQGEGGPPQTLA